MTRKIALIAFVTALAFCLSGCQSRVSVIDSAAVSPQPKAAEKLAACMTEKGWDVVAGFDNSVSPRDVARGIPTDQALQYQSDMTDCSNDLGYSEAHTPTEAQLTNLYNSEITERECLLELGYQLPELPSFETYRDSYGTSSAWDVVALMPVLDQDTYKAVYSKCPPPLWYFEY